MGVVAALYFAAARCRSAPIRHKALSLLKICNRREGFWDSRIAASIAEGVINIEEANLMASQQLHHSPTGAEGLRGQQSYSQIPEHLRVRTVDVQFGPDSSGKAAYSLMNSMEAYMQRNSGGSEGFGELMRW